MSITEYMRNEHRECDLHFAETENAVLQHNWEEAVSKFELFAHDTRLHFKKEEEELFVAFERQTGNSMGPTRVMRYEHEQVRGLMGKMAHALDDKDKDAFLSLAESMMILLQQHNMKEEQMLYAMCDVVLPSATKEETVAKMRQLEL